MWSKGQLFLIELGRVLSYPGFWRIVRRPGTRYALSWLLALIASAIAGYVAWTLFDGGNLGDPNRQDKNSGHTTIDFGGQYLMGRMLVKGRGQDLYHRNHQRQVLSEVYPREDQAPTQEKSDVENLMEWMIGRDDPGARETLATFLLPLGGRPLPAAAVAGAASLQYWTPERMHPIGAAQRGGPLYPPINAFLNYPLALLDPPTGYRAVQALNLLLAYLAALAVRQLSGGRIWWPIAVTAVIAFPGFAGSMNLGQNATLSLTVLLWGWVLMSRGWPVLGGVMWGLLAFKPVWAASFFLVPLLTGRWRTCLAMLATGATLAIGTLPVVGFHAWQEWLAIGRDATTLYLYDENWIKLSRDVLSIPRRWLDFGSEFTLRRDHVPTTIIGWGLYLFFLETTLLWSVFRRDQVRAFTGPGPAFLLLGAWLSCFHFMYYDVLLGALPFFLLVTDPWRYLEPLPVAIVPLGGSGPGKNGDAYYRPRRATEYPPDPGYVEAGRGQIWVLNRVEPTVYVALLVTAYLFPLFSLDLRAGHYDTGCLMALWLWCGWLVFWQARRPAVPVRSAEASQDGLAARCPAESVQLGADVGRTH